MLKRIALLLPDFRFAGWFVLGWTMLAYASTAQFSIWLFRSMSKWLSQNAWVGFVMGFALLAMAIIWPDLQPWISKRFGLPKTLSERLKMIELEHRRLDGIQAKVVERLHSVEAGWSQAIHRLDVIEAAIANTPKFINLVGELNGLATEAESLTRDYGHIRQVYSDSDPAKHPLSNIWSTRFVEKHEECYAIHLGLAWKNSIKAHMLTVNNFCSKTGNPMTTNWPEGNSLYTGISKGDDVMNGSDCEFMLQHHTQRLANARAAYIAAFARDPAAAVVAIL